MTEKTATKGKKDYWSECGLVFFHYGKGYGLTENLATIRLGSEEDILKAFDSGELNPSLSSLQRQVLMQILEYRKEEGYGGSGPRESNMERAADNGIARHKPGTIRQSSAKARLSVRQARPKVKGLSKR